MSSTSRPSRSNGAKKRQAHQGASSAPLRARPARDRRASPALVVRCVHPNELLHLRWRAELIEMTDQGGGRAAVATVGWEEVDDALEPPELVIRSHVVVPQEARGDFDHEVKVARAVIPGQAVRDPLSRGFMCSSYLWLQPRHSSRRARIDSIVWSFSSFRHRVGDHERVELVPPCGVEPCMCSLRLRQQLLLCNVAALSRSRTAPTLPNHRTLTARSATTHSMDPSRMLRLTPTITKGPTASIRRRSVGSGSLLVESSSGVRSLRREPRAGRAVSACNSGMHPNAAPVARQLRLDLRPKRGCGYGREDSWSGTYARADDVR